MLGDAFKMRPVEDTLSTTWLEYFAGTRREQIVGAIRAMRASELEIKTKSGFAIGNVGNIVSTAAAHNYSIRVLHEPEDDNKAHVAVRRWPRDDMTLFELLAADAWCELVFNSDVPKGAQAAPDKCAWTRSRRLWSIGCSITATSVGCIGCSSPRSCRRNRPRSGDVGNCNEKRCSQSRPRPWSRRSLSLISDSPRARGNNAWGFWRTWCQFALG